MDQSPQEIRRCRRAAHGRKRIRRFANSSPVIRRYNYSASQASFGAVLHPYNREALRRVAAALSLMHRDVSRLDLIAETLRIKQRRRAPIFGDLVSDLLQQLA